MVVWFFEVFEVSRKSADLISFKAPGFHFCQHFLARPFPGRLNILSLLFTSKRSGLTVLTV